MFNKHMLVGLVAKNSILLVGLTKSECARGVERGEALFRAVKVRFRYGPEHVLLALGMVLDRN